VSAGGDEDALCRHGTCFARQPHGVRINDDGAIALTVASLYTVGALRSLVTKVGWARSGVEMLLVGTTAAAVAYGIGALAAALTGV